MENRDLTHLTNFDYFREKLFRRISITSAVIERTCNGDLIGGSLGFMTARDWARFGYLYMHDGWWNGVRILAGFSTLAPPAPTNMFYGAHWWLRTVPTPDHFHTAGFRNQNIFLMPSKRLVVVRLAMPSIALSTQ